MPSSTTWTSTNARPPDPLWSDFQLRRCTASNCKMITSLPHTDEKSDAQESAMSLPSNFAFSQASLQDYADCPRRFQLRCVLRVRWPGAYEANAEWERRARQGAAFHQLVHQHAVGLSAEVLSVEARQGNLARWWQAYLTALPPNLPATLRRSEVRLSLPLYGFRLSARYDLLAIEPGRRAAIVDWKTGLKRPRRAWLEKRWQTVVYRYVLIEAGAQLNNGNPFTPHQVELIYWFANYPRQVERFPYDAGQHTAAATALASLIIEIGAREQEEWPLTEDLRLCRYCTYRTFCDREQVQGEDTEPEPESDPFDFELDLEQIAEVEF